MVSQNGRGELVIGDSHEYGAEIEPVRQGRDRGLDPRLPGDFPRRPRRFASRPGGTGPTPSIPDQPYVILAPCPGVLIVTGVGGAGMTLSFGLAEKVVEQVLGPA